MTESCADDFGNLLHRATEWAGSYLAEPRSSLDEAFAALLPLVLAAAGASAGAHLLLDPEGERVLVVATRGRLLRGSDGRAGWPCAGGVARALRTAAVDLLPEGKRVICP